MNSPEPVLIADRFPALLEALLTLLSGLSDEDWQRPSPLPGWSVKDIAQHLLGDELGILSGKRDRYTEAWSPFNTWQELVDWINQRNEAWVAATRRISPPLLVQLMRFAGQQTNAFFASLDPHATGSPVSWAGPDPAPVWLDVAREFTERWHHQQHIRQAVGTPGADEPYFMAPVLATFTRALPHTLRSTEARPGTTLTMIIHGDSGSTWTVKREAEGWVLFSGQPPHPDGRISLSQDCAWRLFTRGLTTQQALTCADLSGSRELVGKALEVTAIIA